MHVRRAARRGRDEAPKQLQVRKVQRIPQNRTGRLAGICLGRLEQHRETREPAVVHEPTKRSHAHEPLADVLMAIDAAAQWPL